MNSKYSAPYPLTENLTPLVLNHQYIDNLPADTEKATYPRQVKQAAYSFVYPTPVKGPELIAFTPELAHRIGFNETDLSSEDFAQLFTGNKIAPGMRPYSCNYGGHQFGQWAGQLGDGRAIMLGEVVTPAHGNLFLQLKGAGLTPYSRTADGRAVLRSSIREFLCSEAMYHLGIPTTRALSLCLTGDPVMRDMFYDGRSGYEPGAVVCRTSRSFTRFGTFQLPASRGDTELLNLLINRCISTDFPHLGDPENQSVRLAWFSDVCNQTCELIIHWMRVGFVHGVMNTDNMSILGETIDFGPYGWIDDFDLNWTPNTTDFAKRRYRYGAQGDVALWNLYQLANALAPVIPDVEALESALKQFIENFQSQRLEMLASKLGFQQPQPLDSLLFDELEILLQMFETDMTLFYRQLAEIETGIQLKQPDDWVNFFKECFYQPDNLTTDYKTRLSAWMSNYLQRLEQEGLSDLERKQQMNRTNPKYVLRNYLSQQAIEKAEKGDFSMIHQLQNVLLSPYDEQPEYEHFAQKRPEWARNKPGCSTLSCSS